MTPWTATLSYSHASSFACTLIIPRSENHAQRELNLQSHHPVSEPVRWGALGAGRANICCRPGHHVSAQDHRLAATDAMGRQTDAM